MSEPPPGGGAAGAAAEMRAPSTQGGHVEQAGPAEFRDPLIRHELKRAAVWFGLGLAILGIVFLAHPLLLIFGGIVFASVLTAARACWAVCFRSAAAGGC